MYGRPFVRLIISLVVISGVLSSPANLGTSSADVPDQTIVAFGFDTCSAPHEYIMDAWWPASPYYYMGLYIGGVNEGCSQSNLSASWVNHTAYTTDGWGFWLIWAGLQSQCDDSYAPYHFSNDTSTAYSQGVSSADAARDAANNLGFNSTPQYNVIYFDLEAFNTSDSTCLAAAESFISGWDTELDTNTNYSGGMYGSTCGTDLQAFASLVDSPSAIAPAYWESSANIYDLPCLGNGVWNNYQRIHQWWGNQSRTYGGYTINPVDGDCAHGQIADYNTWTPGCG